MTSHEEPIDLLAAVREQVERGVVFEARESTMTLEPVVVASFRDHYCSVRVADRSSMRTATDAKDEREHMTEILTMAVIDRMVRKQLPEGVNRRVDIAVTTDPHVLRTKLIVRAADGRVWSTYLEHTKYDGISYAAKIPDEFVAHLCVAI
jgi:hypothetical protein